MKKNQKSERGGIQDILFPHENMNITQGNNGSFSHQGVNALDLAEKNGGRSPFYAPFDVICKAIDSPKNGNAVFWQSMNAVRFADGSIDFATIMIIHDNDLSGIHVGVTYPQGTQIAMEGTAGNASGNHNHFEIAKGKFVRMYDKNSFGIYHLPNSISADSVCFIDGTSIINGAGMHWKMLSQVPVEQPSVGTIENVIPSDFVSEKATFICGVDKINIRRAPSLKGALTGDWYENGMSVKYGGFVKREDFVWISWIGKDGTRRWMAVREIATNKPYGTFK